MSSDGEEAEMLIEIRQRLDALETKHRILLSGMVEIRDSTYRNAVTLRSMANRYIEGDKAMNGDSDALEATNVSDLIRKALEMAAECNESNGYHVAFDIDLIVKAMNGDSDE